MDSMHAPKSTPNPDMARVLQEANALAELLADKAIWAQLVSSGLDSDAQQKLSAQLAATRSSYGQYMAHKRAARAESSSDASLDAALASNCQASDDLNRIMGTIRDVGCLVFRDTTSLKQRFTQSTAPSALAA